ncbi:MAG: UvrD-helicase domain-containing protein [Candidatus Cloacimonetes bacterium]|nr:UvrD-helicase domain-containing protein [Candidatus Cloacimonadota bacterium]
MKFIADFHIHSHFSIATSKDLIPEELDSWAQKKGIAVVGTGDFSHPGWLKELEQKLEPAEQGLFTLRKDFQKVIYENPTRFILTAEISNIYKKHGKVRKVHNVLFAPNFVTVEKIQNKLSQIGNITSDGRPILGLDSRDLLEIVLETSDDAFLIPAHIWTPWFSALGSKSGFDTIDECYDDLADHIFAVETGLSSDPPMNWICSFLDKYTLISNSDAHSPSKLGREANLFETELSYDSIHHAMKSGDNEQFLGTVEFFPQEGKYHFDGHRKCGVCWDPVETLKHNGICPQCGRKVTVGVLNRVAQLADRSDPEKRYHRHDFHSLITLDELLAEILEVGKTSKKVAQAYDTLIQKFGSEFDILLHAPLEEIEHKTNEILAEAIRRMRNGQVHIQEGYDGEYGIIQAFTKEELKDLQNQEALFSDLAEEVKPPSKKPLINFDIAAFQKLHERVEEPALFIEKKKPDIPSPSDFLSQLNDEQKRAVQYYPGPLLILAGPGTGKTRTLTARIAYCIKERGIKPQNILAVTFTNKAAEEMKERLDLLLDTTSKEELHVSTFHSFGYSILREHAGYFKRNSHFGILDEHDKQRFLLEKTECNKKDVKKLSEEISKIKLTATPPSKIRKQVTKSCFEKYEKALRQFNLFDIEDMIYKPVILLQNEESLRDFYQRKLQFILIDEFQDIDAAQYQLIRLIKPDRNANLTAIGDPNQAIYGFRGADVGYIDKFKKDYSQTVTISLLTSYRCSDTILRASNQVIQNQDMLSGLHEGVKVNISSHGTDKSEAEFIAREIEQLIGGVRFFSMDSSITDGSEGSQVKSLADVAILCRLKAQISALEKALNDHSIPYQKVTEISLFFEEPVKSILDVLRLALNPSNLFLIDELLKRNVLTMPDLNELKTCLIEHNVQQALDMIIKKFFKEKVRLEESVRKMMNYVENFDDDFDTFLKFTILGAGVDTSDFTLERVNILTLHAAKGLEFDCVFIAGCEDSILPYSLFEDKKCDLDEERRLFYVGMTRARELLYLTCAQSRFLFGKSYTLPRSPFISAIEQKLLDEKRVTYKKKKKSEPSKSQQELF